jgi:excisionase family DNA binding protein
MAVTRRTVPSMTGRPDNESTGGGERSAPANDEFLTVGNVAEPLRVHPQTVRAWIARGDLRAIRIGRTVRVRRTDFQEMPERARIPPLIHPAGPHVGNRGRAAR